MKKTLLFVFALFTIYVVKAQDNLLLGVEDCRSLAVQNNKSLRISAEKSRAAEYERKAAFTKYLPRISATGTYMYSSREISLLSDDQKSGLENLGSLVASKAPEFSKYADALNGVGSGLADAFHTDTRSMGAVGVMLTQPVYMGGKIAAYNKITGYAEQAAKEQHNLAMQNVILEVDETYWNIVSLCARKDLAESYLKLVKKLDDDVQKLIAEGLATKADGLSVKVKVNEAEVAMIQVDNGLALLKMSLCRICGLDMNSNITLKDEGSSLNDPVPAAVDMNTALEKRPELGLLGLSTKIYDEKVKLERSQFMPTIALTGGYLASNPSVYNGFERKFKGMWSVGVVVNIPIITFGERSFKVKAAKANAAVSRLELDEAREKVELQVNQCRQKVQEAAERLKVSLRSTEQADENLRYANLGLQEGVIPLSNVLEAQTAWLKAHTEHVSSQIDLRLANLYLLKSAGVLSVND